MAINEWLAEVYGTNGSGSDNDLEKTAQAMMLQKLAEEEGVDLSGLDEEQLNALAQEIVQNAEVIEAATSGGEGGGEGEMPAPEPGAPPAMPPGAEEEAQAKFAEADFLGRVMAHSYTQELNKIAEEAAAEEEAEGKEHEEAEKKKGESEDEEEKTAGPLTSAIMKLGGTVGGRGASAKAAKYIEKIAEARAQEMAVGWLRANGYIK